MYIELDPRQDMQPHLPRVLNRDVYYRGQTIISQNAEGFHAYYIEKGCVEVIVKDGTHEVRVAKLGAGEIFGEMALLKDETRSASVRAIEDTTITIISAMDLEEKMARIDEPAIKALINIFIDRLRHANEGQLAQYMALAKFQDRIAGLVEKTAHGIDAQKRSAFREETEPLLAHLEEILEKYRNH